MAKSPIHAESKHYDLIHDLIPAKQINNSKYLLIEFVIFSLMVIFALNIKLRKRGAAN